MKKNDLHSFKDFNLEEVYPKVIIAENKKEDDVEFSFRTLPDTVRSIADLVKKAGKEDVTMSFATTFINSSKSFCVVNFHYVVNNCGVLKNQATSLACCFDTDLRDSPNAFFLTGKGLKFIKELETTLEEICGKRILLNSLDATNVDVEFPPDYPALTVDGPEKFLERFSDYAARYYRIAVDVYEPKTIIGKTSLVVITFTGKCCCNRWRC